jgi:hypothetical protein
MSTEEATLEITTNLTTAVTELTTSMERPNGMFTLDSSYVHQQRILFTVQINAIEHFFQSRNITVKTF